MQQRGLCAMQIKTNQQVVEEFLVHYNRYTSAFGYAAIQLPLSQAQVDVVVGVLESRITANAPDTWEHSVSKEYAWEALCTSMDQYNALIQHTRDCGLVAGDNRYYNIDISSRTVIKCKGINNMPTVKKIKQTNLLTGDVTFIHIHSDGSTSTALVPAAVMKAASVSINTDGIAQLEQMLFDEYFNNISSISNNSSSSYWQRDSRSWFHKLVNRIFP
jgi:hypothetical protein